MTSSLYTCALVGLGRIGYTLGYDKLREQPASHTFALLQNKRIKLLYGVDRDEEKRRAWAGFVKGASTFSSIEELLATAHPDIIVIAVNEAAHTECALKAIKAHPKLVILEKPVALNISEGLALKKAASDEAVPVLINHERRHALDYRMAREYLKKVGKLLSARGRLDTAFYVWRKKSLAEGAYSLLHDGTHLIDAVRYLLGDDDGAADFLFNETITKAVWEDFQEKKATENEGGKGDRSDISGKGDNSDKSNNSDISGKGDSSDKSNKSAISGKGDKSDKHDNNGISGNRDECEGKKVSNSEKCSAARSGKAADNDNSATLERVVRLLCVHYEAKNCPDVSFVFSGGSRYFGFEIELTGTEGRVRIGNGVFDFEKRARSKLYSGFYSLEKDKSIKPPRKTGYFSRMVQNAVDYLDGKAKLASSLDTGLAVLVNIDSINGKLEAMERGLGA